MDVLKRIAVLDDMVEAQMLESMLKEMNIPHIIKSFHDSAYAGLFQNQQGWGQIEAPEQYELEILNMLDDLRT